jgi:serine/threonine protein kinase
MVERKGWLDAARAAAQRQHAKSPLTADQLPFKYKVPARPDLLTWERPGVRKGHPFSDQVKGLDEIGLDLLDKMLKFDPNIRIRPGDALAHPYFAGCQAKYSRMVEEDEVRLAPMFSAD